MEIHSGELGIYVEFRSPCALASVCHTYARTPYARALRLNRAEHHVINANEDDGLREIDTFVSALPE